MDTIKMLFHRRAFLKICAIALSSIFLPGIGCDNNKIDGSALSLHNSPKPPNFVLLMTDDQSWGETGYYHHPVLKTPNLDAMASNGLRFDRFYAGSPVCSPTRASVLTGRASDRAGVSSVGRALRLQEKTLSSALRAAGYSTGHFGKWHLTGLRGPGVPVLRDDPHSPSAFGFDEWLSVTNFFDRNPLMSHNGTFQEFQGDSSAIIVDEAIKFIRTAIDSDKPFLAVIWAGSPHGPWLADDKDKKAFAHMGHESQNYYGELVAFDRSVGVLRKSLRDLGVANNTLIWFCSDNGGIKGLSVDADHVLRGYKGTIWEGGLRVPGIVEWPSVINPRITNYPASTMDIFPTIADILGLPKTVLLEPTDGISLTPLFTRDLAWRKTPIAFRYNGQGALIDNNYKLVATNIEANAFELYDVVIDQKESNDISASEAAVFKRMKDTFQNWNLTVEASIQGKDYPEQKVNEDNVKSKFWMTDERYEPYFSEWKKRPEYVRALKDN